MAFNFGRNRAYRWQDWNVRSSEVNISITHVSQKHLTNLKPLTPQMTELRAALLFLLEDIWIKSSLHLEPDAFLFIQTPVCAYLTASRVYSSTHTYEKQNTGYCAGSKMHLWKWVSNKFIAGFYETREIVTAQMQLRLLFPGYLQLNINMKCHSQPISSP